MAINNVVYRGDDPQWAAQVELVLEQQAAAIAILQSQQAFLKGSTR